MSMFRNVMVYLGLGPDEEYDDSYLYEGEQPESEFAAPTSSLGNEPARSGSHSGPASAPAAQATSGTVGTVGSVRPIRSVDVEEDPGFRVRPISTPDEAQERTVRAVPIQRSKPRAISPQSFGDAKILADEFKRQIPVVMNIQDVDRDLARRLIDFSSGVCYSLGGSMDKLATNVFLLTPKGVEVSDDDRRRIEERGFDR